MKFLHSPSSSSSSSTSETRRHSYATIGCIPTILRRVLGFNSLHTLPLDQNVYKSNEFGGEINCDDNKLKGNPGIVAKLMGLDSMPVDELKLEKRGNFVLKAPSFVELENDKFIILSFEGGGKDKELGLNYSKVSIKSTKNTRDDNNREISICQSKQKDVEVCKLFDLKSDFNKKLRKLCDAESDSENSSPVSVLEFPDHQEASSHSGKECSTLQNSNSRRRLRENLDKNALSSSSSSSSSPSTRVSCNSVDDSVELSETSKNYVGTKKNGLRNYKEIWDEICKIAEKDVMDSSKVQKERWKGEDFEEISMSFVLQILDQLILELFTIT